MCTTARAGIGQPIVDNKEHFVIPVAQEDASGNYPRDGRGYPTAGAVIVGWSKNCAANRRFDYVYRNTAGAFAALPNPTGPLPSPAPPTPPPAAPPPPVPRPVAPFISACPTAGPPSGPPPW